MRLVLEKRGGSTGLEKKQWGAQENLWPKFIFKSAPLRATSSASGRASPVPLANV
jgi:hypothetical protein